MSKKTIKHIDGKKAAQNIVNAKEQTFVDVKWESTPTWNVLSVNSNSDNKKDYKLFTEDTQEDDNASEE